MIKHLFEHYEPCYLDSLQVGVRILSTIVESIFD